MPFRMKHLIEKEVLKESIGMGGCFGFVLCLAWAVFAGGILGLSEDAVGKSTVVAFFIPFVFFYVIHVLEQAGVGVDESVARNEVGEDPPPLEVVAIQERLFGERAPDRDDFWVKPLQDGGRRYRTIKKSGGWYEGIPGDPVYSNWVTEYELGSIADHVTDGSHDWTAREIGRSWLAYQIVAGVFGLVASVVLLGAMGQVSDFSPFFGVLLNLVWLAFLLVPGIRVGFLAINDRDDLIMDRELKGRIERLYGVGPWSRSEIVRIFKHKSEWDSFAWSLAWEAHRKSGNVDS